MCTCGNQLTEEDIRIQEYGELYFTMNCWWSNQELIAPTLFHCSETVATELISGYISLAIEEDLNGEKFFSICGRNIMLNSGHHLHDTIIPALTEHNYNCINSYERNLGDEFDWVWEDTHNMLQIIWRPKDEKDKVLTLFVDEKEDSHYVLGSVYYKTGYFN